MQARTLRRHCHLRLASRAFLSSPSQSRIPASLPRGWHLLTAETMGLKLNMFGYDDQELNDAIVNLMKNPGVAVQGTLDQLQAALPFEKKMLATDLAGNPDFYNSFVVTRSATSQISHTKGGVLIGQGLAWEGSVNWSASGEGTGIRIDPAAVSAPGYVAQNNTLVVTANPVFIARFGARLDTEHKTGLMRRAQAEGKL